MATLLGTRGKDILRGTMGSDDLYGLRDDDYIRGLRGDDSLFGGLNSDTLVGGVGNDVLHGGGGRDWLYGDTGNDLLLGDGGDDTLQEGAGRDSMFGGAGDDCFVVVENDRVADLFAGGEGADSLRVDVSVYDPDLGWTSPTVRVNLLRGTLRIGDDPRDSLFSIENVQTGDGDDAVNGNRSANLIQVGDGSNVVYAGGGDDTIIGGSHVEAGSRGEILHGGSGNDYINAGGSFVATDARSFDLGMQRIVGGEGDDTLKADSSLGTLSGGKGADEFWFDTGLTRVGGQYAATQATITDYAKGETIWINPVNTGGDLVFVGETDEPLGSLEVGYHREGDDTVIVANTADGATEMTIRLAGFTGDLAAEDFVLTYAPDPYEYYLW